jgi:hypothetical protein
LEKAAEHGAQHSVKIKKMWDSPDGYLLHGAIEPAFDCQLQQAGSRAFYDLPIDATALANT